MDVLSSQANIAGYKAVIVAADVYGRFMPMLMTAAGTVKAARVLVLGVGVAGLQAIATAKRLGAVIEASDVRPSVRDQVESLGGKWVDVPYETDEEREIADTIAADDRIIEQDGVRLVVDDEDAPCRGQGGHPAQAPGRPLGVVPTTSSWTETRFLPARFAA